MDAGRGRAAGYDCGLLADAGRGSHGHRSGHLRKVSHAPGIENDAHSCGNPVR